MPKTAEVLAFDLGAGSGRALIGKLAAGTSSVPARLHIEEVHRFSNIPVRIGKHLHWNIASLLHEVKTGLRIAFRSGHQPSSYGMDTWGVDFGLIDRNGELLGLPYHYRDEQTSGMVEQICARVGRNRLFAESGLEFMPFNTIYQLAAMKQAGSPLLDAADKLLLMPDLLHYFLTGKQSCEFSMATTTQLYHVQERSWNVPLIEELGLRASMFLDPVQPGTVIGSLREEVCRELGVPAIQAIAVASHDTESAAVSVPASSDSFAYLVCGTWSLLGTELQEPLLHQEVLDKGFSNEGGAFGTFQLLKNIMGLWILEECKRKWDREERKSSYEELLASASSASPFRSFIIPADLRFMNPEDMEEEIRGFCRETGQSVPDSKGELVRCILESLALCYREVLEKMEHLTGQQYEGLHMVGGGIQNKLLCRFTASAIGRPVWAGPVEASAIGNMLLQLYAIGAVQSRKEGIELVRNSFSPEVYMPGEADSWNDAYSRYSKLAGRKEFSR